MKQISTRFWWKCLLALLTTTAMLLFVVSPLIGELLLRSDFASVGYQSYLNQYAAFQFYLMHLSASLWVFSLGSCFASFLNVVAWRLPRGRSIGGFSQCPHCLARLRLTENLPVLGWLKNEGLCGHCRAPIPLRYLLVELWLGTVFLAIAYGEIFTGGASLPFQNVSPEFSIGDLLYSPNIRLFKIWTYHVILICLLFPMALIASEGLQPPIQLAYFGLSLGLVLPWIFPATQVLNCWFNQTRLTNNVAFSTQPLLNAGWGTCVGFLTGFVFQFSSTIKQAIIIDHSHSKNNSSSVLAFALVGCFLGWQSVILIGLVTAALHFLLTTFAEARTKQHTLRPDVYIDQPDLRSKPVFLDVVPLVQNLSALIFAVTLLHLLTWRWTIPICFSAI